MLRRAFATATRFSWKDVNYTAQHHPKQSLDIAIPTTLPSQAKLPACIFVHGGSWQRGDKAGAFNDGIDEAFVGIGCIGVSVNYRLSPEVRHPEHARDVAAAVQWLHMNIDKYGGDPTSFYLIGHSAGAHLVMHLLANPQYLADVGVAPDVVKGIVGVSGVYNVVRLANAPFYGALTVNPAFGERVDQWREGSVITALARGGAESPLLKTPVLLVNAEEDSHLPEDTSELARWLTDGGNTAVDTLTVPGTNHFTVIHDIAQNEGGVGMQRIKQFVADTHKEQQHVESNTQSKL